ncbi:flippase [Croceitalea sp. MTPC9]|uniref:oligosaccharide flippase family protein n=1 Tax=unclassified Croceitalea TaxID=2632280 RepID=UPI002B370E6D|nr:flippase [Croceitalea sp. MTPC6]GMN15854.1 flippase [Croceitalea sp. MTPC9]
MGIVLKQSLKNTTITYIGFGIGAINILFLYTKILPDVYFGLVNVILATAAILMPLLAFGVHNAMVKFYSGQREEDKDSFLTLMLVSPLMVLFPLALGTWLFYDDIANFLSKENEIVRDYVWYIFLVAFAMAYFEVFYAWCKVHLKSVFGNFLKEVFARLCVMILLGMYYFEIISLDFFLMALVGVYLLRTLIIKLYAYYIRKPKLDFNFPKETKSILSYSLLIILGGSAALILLEIDKVMINQFVEIENVAYYSVAVFIATVIIVPSRAMHNITYPLTAELLNSNNLTELRKLYQKTSLTLFIASGILFLLIVLNLEELYKLLPKAYRGGFYIVLLIGSTKVLDSLLGNNNAILYNSKYYKTVLLFGVCLAILTILLNLWLIPSMGIEGAALASFIAICLFNILKLWYVNTKFKIQPFTGATAKILATLVVLGALFSYLNFSFHPIINIILKSALLVAMYVGILYRFKISEDVNGILSKFLNKRS